MKYLVYLMTLLFSTAVAQNPTILQGNYVSNVFGQANFVLNPNAQTSTTNVTVSSATVTRPSPIVTPLVATTEFNVEVTSANGTITWATRSFDAGMKNQNCEARFTYRGFQATSKAQVKQGSNVVAELVLTPSATDPRIASINFPCGDLSSATTFVITDTATLAGTNEIGGIYVGLATNQANVAQATKVGGFNNISCSAGEARLTTGTAGLWYAPNIAGGCSGTAVGSASSSLSNVNLLTFTFTNLVPGEYLLMMPAYVYANNVATGTGRCDGRIRETTLNLIDGQNSFAKSPPGNWYSIGQINQFKFTNPSTANRTFQIEFMRNGGTGWECAGGFINTAQNLSLYRFPSSSELVVTPESQNVFAGIRAGGGNITNLVTTTGVWTKLTSAGTLTRVNFGKAKVETNNDYSLTVENMPVGSYAITVTGQFHAEASAAGNSTPCIFGISDSVGGTIIAAAQQSGNGDSSLPTQANLANTFTGIYTNSSVANRTFTVQAFRITGNGKCYAYASADRPLTMTVTPLDNNANSALYVQGPVKAAGTGTAIPAGYVGEVKLATDSVQRVQASPVYGTWYKLTTAELTLEPGVWQICFFTLVQAQYTTPSTSYPSIATAVYDLTSSPNQLLYLDVEVGPDTSANNDWIYSNAGKCQVNSFTQTTNIGLRTRINTFSGSPAFSNLYHRCDSFQCWLQATRIN